MPSPTRKESLSGFVERTMGVKPAPKPRYGQAREELKGKKKA